MSRSLFALCLILVVTGTTKAAPHSAQPSSRVISYQGLKWPELNEEERNTVSQVIAKALEGKVLDDQDLAKYREAIRKYTVRANKRQPPEEMKLFRDFLRVLYEYNQELGQCLLESLEKRTPVLTAKLKTLQKQSEQFGTRRARLDSDYRKILSAATGAEWTDESGKRHASISRSQVLAGLKRNQAVKASLDKIVLLYKEFSE